MISSIWLPVLAASAVFVAVAAAAVLFVGFLAWRYLYRKWRLITAHGAVVAAVGVWQATAARSRPGPPPSADELTGWPARRVRKQLWHSVDRADAAVRVATDMGAPTASLPFLCHRLHEAAGSFDQVLKVDPSATVSHDVAGHAAVLFQTAADVQRAAATSAGDAAGHRVDELAADAVNELQCLDAGLTTARTALPAHRH